MLILPDSCLKDVIIAKDRFKQHKTEFRDLVKQIKWKYVIDEYTTNYEAKTDVKTINIIQVKLKTSSLAKVCLKQISDSISSCVIFELIYNEEVCYAFYEDELYYSKFNQDLNFNLTTIDLNSLFDNLRRTIINDFTTNESVKESLTRISKNNKLNLKIQKLEIKMRKEVQPNKQLQLKLQINRLKREMKGIL